MVNKLSIHSSISLGVFVYVLVYVCFCLSVCLCVHVRVHVRVRAVDTGSGVWRNLDAFSIIFRVLFR